MPPANKQRRAQLADAAITLLARAGIHGVTHRAVETTAGLPAGTASNYFRSREALLLAAAERVGELHRADMEQVAGPPGPAPGSTRDRATGLIAGSLLLAATTYRPRYLAVFELRLESLRRPALAEALAALEQRSIGYTIGHHRIHGLDIPAEVVPTLVALYGGALFTLVSAPTGTVTAAVTHSLAAAIVRAGLGDEPA